MPVALITGSSRGIGNSIARLFLQNGYQVILNGRHDWDTAELAQFEPNFSYYKFDVTKKDQVDAAVAAMIAQYGRIDVLVNNAGITRDKSFLKMDSRQWEDVMDVNLKGVYHLCKAVLPHMCEKSAGRIVNIASVVGLSGNFGQANYAASKAGLIGLTKSLALEMASKNITVNAVAPGFINTEMTKSLPQSIRDSIVQKIPLGDFGSVEDVAQAVFFLAGSAARYITGETLSVNGGMHLH